MLVRPMLSSYWDRVGEQFQGLQQLQRLPSFRGYLTCFAVLAVVSREVLGGNVWRPLAPPGSLSSRGNLASPASGPVDDLGETRAVAAAEAGGEDEGDLAAEPEAGEVAQVARVLGKIVCGDGVDDGGKGGGEAEDAGRSSA